MRIQWPIILFQFVHSCTRHHLNAMKHKQLVGPFAKDMHQAPAGWHPLELHFVLRDQRIEEWVIQKGEPSASRMHCCVHGSTENECQT